MKKKILLFLFMMLIFACTLAVSANAKDVYLEPIPDELKAQNDTFTHFVVFEEEKYFVSSGDTINGLNTDVMNNDMNSEGIDKSKIGSEYLTRYNVPAYIGETLITYVNLNSMKTHQYFENVCGYVQLAGTVSKVHDMNDCVQQLRCVDFGENSQITVLPDSFARNAKKMASVKNLPRNLTTIGPQAFNNCYGAFRGELYINATAINDFAFNNAISNVTHIVLGPNVKSIGTQALTVVVKGEIPAFYAPSDLKAALVSIEFQCDVSQIKFATQGNNTGAFYFPVSSARTAYEKLTSIILSHPDNVAKVTEGSIFNDFTADGITILFNDADGLDDYVTTHDFSICSDIRYERFDEDGVMTMSCSKCGARTTKVATALLTCLGYSVGPDGYSLKAGFKINPSEIERYITLYPNFKFGIIILNANSISSSENVFEGYVLNDKIKGLEVEISSIDYQILNVDIGNFDIGIASSLELSIGAYAIDTNGNISVMQYVDTNNYKTTKSFADMSLNAITLNQVRLAHEMEVLVPQAPSEGDEE